MMILQVGLGRQARYVIRPEALVAILIHTSRSLEPVTLGATLSCFYEAKAQSAYQLARSSEFDPNSPEQAERNSGIAGGEVVSHYASKRREYAPPLLRDHSVRCEGVLHRRSERNPPGRPVRKARV